jgi:hypothetical protein
MTMRQASSEILCQVFSCKTCGQKSEALASKHQFDKT